MVAGRALVVEQISVEAIGHMAVVDEPERPVVARTADEPLMPADRSTWSPHARRTSRPRRSRRRCSSAPSLRPGDRIDGPAIIVEATTTVVVEPGWRAELTARDHLLLSRVEALPERTAIGTHADPIMLEVFNNLFMSIAEQMGVTLQNTAYSVNMKERLDFSCALFDQDGMLIANAPHMPVHLGSMGESVRTILRLRGATMRPGDVFALNNPYNGGTHLPDVTVIMPVFGDDGQLLFLSASRGHHADIGGITPGLDAAGQHLDRGGRRADRRLPAGRRGPLPRRGARRAARLGAAIRRAIRARTWPICRPRSRPARAVPASSSG